MALPVPLNEIVDQLEVQFDETSSWLDRDTGELYGISNDLLGLAEDGDEPDLPDWQKEEWGIAKRIVEGGSFVRLPTKWDVHEWEILNEFAQSLDHASIREELLDAIHGPGAFRMFRNVIQRRRMDSVWNEFRAAALRRIAIDWCEGNGIPWCEEKSRR